MSTALRLVEGSSMDKSKALDAALSQIERTFGKGSIMRLGKNDKSRPRSRCIAWRRRRRRAASAPSSMPNTRSIRSMRASSASMSTIF
jgi:hypothetical protein